MKISIKEMLATGMHFGHKKRFCNPEMMPYIHSLRHGIHVIDLSQTKIMLENAMKAVTQLASKGGKVLFVGTKPAAQRVTEEAAKKAGMPYVNTRWLGGMLTNYKTIRNSVRKLDNLESLIESGKINQLTKKEMLMELRKYEKLLYNIGGIRKMRGLPDVLFVVDVSAEQTAITEARKLGIPVIGVVDTNSSPRELDYIIPGNDDSVASIQYYLDCMTEAIIAGQAKMEKPKEAAKPKTKVSVKASEEKKPAPKKRATKSAESVSKAEAKSTEAPTKSDKAPSDAASEPVKAKADKKEKAPAKKEAKAPKASAEKEKPVKKASPKKTAEEKPKAAAKKQSESKE